MLLLRCVQLIAAPQLPNAVRLTPRRIALPRRRRVVTRAMPLANYVAALQRVAQLQPPPHSLRSVNAPTSSSSPLS
jgi:hypothetical protein